MKSIASPIVEQVALEIYIYTTKKNEKIWFSKLVEFFKGKIEKKDISKAEDVLFDLCIIDADWEIVDEKWVRCYSFSRCYTPFFEELYKRYSYERC